jgi:hypothetical protein
MLDINVKVKKKSKPRFHLTQHNFLKWKMMWCEKPMGSPPITKVCPNLVAHYFGCWPIKHVACHLGGQGVWDGHLWEQQPIVELEEDS